MPHTHCFDKSSVRVCSGGSRWVYVIAFISVILEKKRDQIIKITFFLILLTKLHQGNRQAEWQTTWQTDRQMVRGGDGRWAAVTDIQPSVSHSHSLWVLSARQKSTTLVSAGRELPNTAVNRALNPNPLAKCKRGIRAHVKTAYSQTVCSKRPRPIHGVIQSDSTLSLLLSDNPVHCNEEGWCLADVREHGIAFC